MTREPGTLDAAAPSPPVGATKAGQLSNDGAGPSDAVRHADNQQTRAQQATSQEPSWRMLFDTMLNGFALHEIICDDEGRPVDYRFIEVNPAFERLTGLKAADLVNHTVREVLPQTEPMWIERYGKVALTGKPAEFESYSQALDRHYHVSAFCPQRGQFAVVFEDVTPHLRIQAALAQQSNANAALAELGKALISLASLDDISWLVLEKAKELTESIYGYVGYIDPETQTLVSASLTRDIWDSCEVEPKEAIFRKFSGLWGWVLEHRRPLVSNDPANDPRSCGVPDGHIAIERFASVPAMIGDTLVGQIAVANPPRDYTDADLAILERMASLYAIAVESQRARQALKQHGDKQAALYAIAAAVASLRSPEELLSAVIDEVVHHLKAKAAWIAIPADEADGSVKVIVSQGLSETAWESTASGQRGACPLLEAHLTEERDTTSEVVMDCETLPAELVSGRNCASCVPIIVGGTILGTLSLVWETPPALATDHELLRTIGQQIGIALQNSRHYQEAKQTDRLRTLTALDRALQTTLDPDRIVDETLRHTTTALKATRATMLVKGRERAAHFDSETHVSPIWAHQLLSENEAALLEALAERVGPSGDLQPALVAELCSADSCWNRTALQLWHANDVVVPIGGDGGVSGLVVLGRRDADPPFSEEDLHLLRTAANRAGQALQNAQLYESLRALLRERERTQSLMIHTEKMAALGRLAASLAHEVNNPLQAVQGCLALAKEMLDDIETARDSMGDVTHYLAIAEEEIQRVATIVRRMRDFYRPSEDAMVPTDLHAVLEAVLALAAKQLQHSKITIERAWAERLPLVQANADHLKQVFLNLILNAEDAMSTGGTLRITTSVDPHAGSPASGSSPVVRITFSDTGIGMSREAISRLFEPFFTTKEQGSGLGLSIAYSIVKAHHGEIGVTSQEGAGTTFTVYLPVTQGT